MQGGGSLLEINFTSSLFSSGKKELYIYKKRNLRSIPVGILRFPLFPDNKDRFLARSGDFNLKQVFGSREITIGQGLVPRLDAICRRFDEHLGNRLIPLIPTFDKTLIILFNAFPLSAYSPRYLFETIRDTIIGANKCNNIVN